MQDKHLFEYAIIRAVPRVEREEFVNVGVIFYCASQRFLQMRWVVDSQRLPALFPQVNLAELEQRLQAFEKICLAAPASGPIGQLPLASRFRWLTASRSTVVQCSPIHPGLCANPLHALERLFEQVVL